MKKIMYAVLGMVLFASCNKEEFSELVLEERRPLEFEVIPQNITYKANDSVWFDIEGDPGRLVFWSGEIGHDYDHRNENRYVLPEDILLQFRLRHQYKLTRTSSTFSVLSSKDFDGDRLSFDDVDGATWTDITGRFDEFDVDGLTYTNKISVKDLWEQDKPLYFAFKYVFDPSVGNGQGSWGLVSHILVETVTNGETTLLSGELTSDFPRYGAVSPDKNPTRSQNRYYDPIGYPTSNLLVMYSNSDEAKYTEEYFVSVPYKVDVQDLGPDKPIAVTDVYQPTVTSFGHAYSEPGVYKVVFIGTDPALRENNQVIKEFEITILPADEEEEDD